MKNIKVSFKHENGKIYLVMSQQIWGETVIREQEVTDDVMPVVDDFLDERLGLNKKIKK